MDNLRRLRKEHKITQKELAKIIGITEVSMCRYEKERRKLPIEKAKKIAEIFGVNWYELYE